MAFTFTKTVNGRQYRYKRISTTRVGKKVVTKDKCLGPVDPVVRGKIEAAPQSAQKKLIATYQSSAVLPDMVRWFQVETGITVSERTISNYMKRHGIKRGFNVVIDMSDHTKRVHAEKRRKKVDQEKRTRAHLKTLIDEGVIKPADVVTYTQGAVDAAAVEAVWARHIKGSKAKKKSKM